VVLKLTFTDGLLTVKGPKGTLELAMREDVNLVMEGSEITLTPANEQKRLQPCGEHMQP